MNRIIGFYDITQSYEIMNTIGRGTFGVVNIAKHKKSGALVAIKQISKNKLKTQDLYF